jgi:hypothetical protein
MFHRMVLGSSKELPDSDDGKLGISGHPGKGWLIHLPESLMYCAHYGPTLFELPNFVSCSRESEPSD